MWTARFKMRPTRPLSPVLAPNEAAAVAVTGAETAAEVPDSVLAVKGVGHPSHAGDRRHCHRHEDDRTTAETLHNRCQGLRHGDSEHLPCEQPVYWRC